MAVCDLTGKVLDLRVRRGADVRVSMRLRRAGVVVDLTAYTASAHHVTSAGTRTALTTVIADNRVVVTIPHTHTLPNGKWVCSITNGTISPVVSGTFTVLELAAV